MFRERRGSEQNWIFWVILNIVTINKKRITLHKKMNSAIEEITDAIERATATFYKDGLSNLCDEDVKIVYGNQLLFGVTYPDPIGNDISHYKSKIRKALNLNDAPRVLTYAFDDESCIIAALQSLSKQYNASLDVPRMMRRITLEHGRFVYLVISIIEIPIVAGL